MPKTTELLALAAILADWAEPAVGASIYVYGSRVRGDHRPDSDVDIFVHFSTPTQADVEWWIANNDDDFASINSRLPGKLEILEPNDSLRFEILAAAKQPVHTDRNVICVYRPSHRNP